MEIGIENNGEVKLPGLNNHTMGVVFKELIRNLKKRNNEEV